MIASDRPKIFNYIIDRFGVDKTARVPTFGTMAEKGAIDGICNALDKCWIEQNPEKNNSNSPYNLAMAKKIKEEYESNPEKTKEKYPDVFYYLDGFLGNKVSQSIHAAGMVISPVTLADNYGVFLKDEALCLRIDMVEIHEVG